MNKKHVISWEQFRKDKMEGVYKVIDKIKCPACGLEVSFIGREYLGLVEKYYCLNCNQEIFFIFDKKGVTILN